MLFTVEVGVLGIPALTVVEQTEFHIVVAKVEQFPKADQESLFLMFVDTVLSKLDVKSTLSDTALEYALD